MSDTGKFINGMWATEKLSWYTEWRLSGRMRPYPGWLRGISILMSFHGLIILCGVLMITWVAPHFQEIQWSRAVISAIGVAAWYSFWMHFFAGPDLRVSLRDKLVKRGELFTPDSKPFQMLAPVLDRYDGNAYHGELISRVLMEMHRMQHRYGELCYLSLDEDAQIDWGYWTAPAYEAPLVHLAQQYGGINPLFAHIEQVIAKDRAALIKRLEVTSAGQLAEVNKRAAELLKAQDALNATAELIQRHTELQPTEK